MFVHVVPSPLYPLLHAHVNEPAVSVHVASAGQLCAAVVHSSMFVHVVPSPLYPLLHAHVNEPAVSVHVASA